MYPWNNIFMEENPDVALYWVDLGPQNRRVLMDELAPAIAEAKVDLTVFINSVWDQFDGRQPSGHNIGIWFLSWNRKATVRECSIILKN